MYRLAGLPLIFVLALTFPLPVAHAAPPSPIQHVVVIMQENHTFDNLFGHFPRANGLSNTTALPLTKGGNPVVRPYHLNNPSLPRDICHQTTVDTRRTTTARTTVSCTLPART